MTWPTALVFAVAILTAGAVLLALFGRPRPR